MRPPSPMLLSALRRAAYQRTSIVPSSPLHLRSAISRSTALTHLRSSSSSSPKDPTSTSPSPASSQKPVSNPDASPASDIPTKVPRGTDRGPVSEETTQTDFAAMNVLGSSTPPSTAIDVCLSDGFQLDNGVDIGGGSGCLLVQGEAFRWRPWAVSADSNSARTQAQAAKRGMPPPNAMLNAKGQWEVPHEVWGVLETVWPKPDLLVLGLGATIYPLAPATKHHLNALGIQVDIQDTRNAAAQFNLLATERGVRTIAAALLPVGWKGRR